MARWFRFYDEALDDPKVQRLPPHLFRTWVNLLCLASKDGGKLPSNDDIAFRLRISVQDAAQQVEDLILAGLIDLDAKSERAPHNWQSRQYASDTSAERMKKHRENKRKKACDVTCDAGVTVQNRSDSETDTDTENKLQVSEQVAAQEVKSELGFNLSSKFGFGRDGMETLTRQAEGLGLDVAEIIALTNKNAKPSKREGYFVTLCVNRLKGKLPGIDDQIIRDALNGKFEQYKSVVSILAGAS